MCACMCGCVVPRWWETAVGELLPHSHAGNDSPLLALPDWWHHRVKGKTTWKSIITLCQKGSQDINWWMKTVMDGWTHQVILKALTPILAHSVLNRSSCWNLLIRKGIRVSSHTHRAIDQREPSEVRQEKDHVAICLFFKCNTHKCIWPSQKTVKQDGII